MMTKEQLINVLPMVREAIAISTGGEIKAEPEALVVSIHCDMKRLLALIDQAVEEKRQEADLLRERT